VASPADDLPHRAGGGSDWAESWWFDFATGDGAIGGFLRLTVIDARGAADSVMVRLQ